MKLLKWTALAGALSMFLLGGAANAQTYPDLDKQIVFVSPFAAGGVADTITRMYTKRLEERNPGLTALVDTRPGASSLNAIRFVSARPADGYTVLLSTVTLATFPKLNAAAQYDPTADFQAIAGVAQSDLVLLVKKDLPVNTLEEYVAYAKENGPLLHGVTGVGSFDHLASAEMGRQLGLDLKVIPYTGVATLGPDLLSGRLDSALIVPQTFAAHIEDGTLRAISSSSSSDESVTQPGLKSIKASGYPDFQADVWYAFFTASGIPEDVLSWLSTELSAIQQEPEFIASIQQFGMAPFIATAEEIQDRFASENDSWANIIEQNNIRLE